MAKTLAHLDLTRTVVCLHENPEDSELCKHLIDLYIWTVYDQIHMLSDEDIEKELLKLTKNYNKNVHIKSAITNIQVIKRSRIDDLIY